MSILEQFQDIKAFAVRFKKQIAYYDNLKSFFIRDQKAKIVILEQRLKLLVEELRIEQAKLDKYNSDLVSLEVYIPLNMAKYEVFEALAADSIQKLAEKVNTERAGTAD